MKQKVGSLLLLVAFGLALMRYPNASAVVLSVVGLLDIWLVFVQKKESISAYIRKLMPWSIDRIILVGLVPLCWWLCGLQIAVWFTLGLLNAHFFNIEEKKGNRNAYSNSKF